MPLADALAAVQAWYAARGLPPRVQTVEGSELDAAIGELGFSVAELPAQRQVAAVAAVLDHLTVREQVTPPHRPTGVLNHLTEQLPDDFLDLYRGGGRHPHAPAVLTSGGADITFAVARDPRDGTVLACGRLAHDRATGWAGLSAIAVAARVRRRGFARSVLRDLVQRAADVSAAHLYLEVDALNAEAVPLYAALGFEVGHTYHCRTPQSLPHPSAAVLTHVTTC